METDENKLVEIRKVCLKVDTMIEENPEKWRGSLQWLTGQIMCIAKFGEGYPNYNSPKGDMKPGSDMFPIGFDIGSIHPGETKSVEFRFNDLCP